jgi:hypothetical protein
MSCQHNPGDVPRASFQIRGELCDTELRLRFQTGGPSDEMAEIVGTPIRKTVLIREVVLHSEPVSSPLTAFSPEMTGGSLLRNDPGLDVPQPHSRPGEEASLSDLQIPAAGLLHRPPVEVVAAQIREFAFGLIRGPFWVHADRHFLGTARWDRHDTGDQSAGGGDHRPHKIVERPVIKNGAVEGAKFMNVSISCDHRVVDGWDAASFVQR